MGKFRQIFMELSAHNTIMVGYYSLTFLSRDTLQPLYNSVIAGIQSKNMLADQLCCIQTKMCRLYRKMGIYGHFSIQSIHFCLDTSSEDTT